MRSDVATPVHDRWFRKAPAATLALTLALGACSGGGGQDPMNASPPPASSPQPAAPASPSLPVSACAAERSDQSQLGNLGGAWSGISFDWDPARRTMSLGVSGLVAEDGRAYFLRDDWTMYWGQLRSYGSSDLGRWVEGPVEAGIVPGARSSGSRLWNGGPSAVGGADGMLVVGRCSLVGDFQLGWNAANTTSWFVALDMRFDSAYYLASTLDAVTGNYRDPTALIGGIHGGVLNISGDGTLFVQSATTGCVANGRISIIDPRYNAYGVELTYSNCAGDDSSLNGARFTGLARLVPQASRLVVYVGGRVADVPTADYFWFTRT